MLGGTAICDTREMRAVEGRDGGGAAAGALARAQEQIETLMDREAEATKELYAALEAGGGCQREEGLRAEGRRLRKEIRRLRDGLPELQRAVEEARRAEQLPVAESLTRRARDADRQRTEALGELDGSILHAFAKLAAFERAQREVEQTRAQAEHAWQEVGLDPAAARRRVDVAREPAYDVLGHHGSLWMRSVLGYLRAARGDFVGWWRP